LNPVQRENLLPGTGAWRLPQAPAGTVQGYASEVSVQPGDVIHLHVSTVPAQRYRVIVYRIGWYRGWGGRLVACSPDCQGDVQGSPQPVRAFDLSTGFLDAGWPVTDQLTVGDAWTSGYYLVELVLTTGLDAGQGSWIPVIVREPPSQDSQILVQAAVNTWQAYNTWGGRSLYYNHTGIGDNHVSFNRPYDPTQAKTAQDGLNLNLPPTWEFPLVRFLERYGYDVSYTSDVDIDANPDELLRHRLVVVAGHDEYWTKTLRDAFELARGSGTNLAFMGANTGYWQIRYADNQRTIVEYRNANADPEPDPALKTVRFRDLQPPRPECQLLGIQSGGIGIRDYAVNPAAISDPWFKGTGFTATSSFPGLVGYEWDAITPGCQTPPLTDFFHYEGHQYANADAVRYTAPSGARVFAAGSFRFSWGLDPSTNPADPGPTYRNPGLQRFMQNALNDLTRPASATSLQTRRRGKTVVIAIARHPDPRVLATLVYRGRRLVCRTTRTACVDHHPPSGHVPRYVAVLQDPWGTSTPVQSNP
jgi:hypothetical protein